MRQIAALLSLLFALPAVAAELWRWKDADGVVHYSDRPVQGAERIDVRSSQKTTGEATPKSTAPVTPPPPAAVNYTRCEVTAPMNDQVFNNVSAVEAAIALEPDLQGDYQLQVLLNGTAYPQWPPAARAHTLINLYRGSYTLAVRILDSNGRAVCTGRITNFHVRQPSILMPGRKPPPK
jgi:hypothetical protein